MNWIEFNPSFELIVINNCYNDGFFGMDCLIGQQIFRFVKYNCVYPYRHYWTVDEELDIMNRNT